MKNTRLCAISLVAMFVLSSFLMATPLVMAGQQETGNGAPSGPHFNLNIIGMPKVKNGDGLMVNDGHRIFVPLTGSAKIWLTPGEEFKVLDADGTDGSAALQLIDPYPGETETAVYRIFVRALGKPLGSANITSGFVDDLGQTWLSLEVVTVTRTHGQTRFSDKTLELTTIYVDITNDGQDNPIRYKLFDNALWDYFWQYDNAGLKVCQLRFYMCDA